MTLVLGLQSLGKMEHPSEQTQCYADAESARA
jgi:hypothetical protein